jgi:two-component system response regulator DesR
MCSGRRGFEVVAEAASGDQALAMARNHVPDVAVLDITMPGMTGLQVAAALHEELPGVRVVILSMHDNPEYVLEAVRAGATPTCSGPGRHGARDAVARCTRRVVLQPADRGDAHHRGRGELEEAQRGQALAALTGREGRAARHREGDEQGDRGAVRISHRTVRPPREPDAKLRSARWRADAVRAGGGLDVGAT